MVAGPGLALALGVDKERIVGGFGGDGEVVVVSSTPLGRSLHLSSVYAVESPPYRKCIPACTIYLQSSTRGK